MEEQQRPEPGTAHSGLRVRQRLVLARLALVWERLWVRLWAPVSLAGAFIAIALTDVLAHLPPWLHVLSVAVAAGAIVFAAARNLRSFEWPTRDEARARLETTSPVVHRPLTTVEDQLAADADPIQRLLWRLHQHRAKAELARLRATAPAPGVARRDRFALRAAVILALVIAMIGGTGTIRARLWRNVVPSFTRPDPNIAIKLWVTPPAYTGRSPVYVEIPSNDGREIDKLDVPDGSKALVVVTGTPRETALAMDGALTPLDRLGDASQRRELDLKPMKRLELREGTRVLSGWDVNWIADRPPTIAFAGQPAEASRWRLKVDYKAADDYGVQDAAAEFTRADDKTAEPAVVEVPLTVPPFAPKVINQSTAVDLAAHPWAGLKVKVRLKATDLAGQTGFSDTIETTLPERAFIHPVARELAKWRKALIADAKTNAAPADNSVTEILKKPDAFGGDPLVHLTLSAARYRLDTEPPTEIVKTVPDLFWHAAVRIEDGNLAAAEQRVLAAEKALKDAIEKGASADDIKKMVDNLQQALNDYAKAKQDKQESNFAANQNEVSPELQQMMQQLKQLADMGAKDAAKKQMAQLEEKLQQMRDQSNSSNDLKDVKDAEKLIQDMKDLQKKQADLLNKTFDKARQEAQKAQSQRQQDQRNQQQNDQASDPTGAQSAAEQEQLRKQLSEVMDRMKKMTGKDSQGMSEAQESMADARDALKGRAWQLGADAQTKALSKMQQGSEEAQQQIAQSLFEKGLGGLVEMPGEAQMRFQLGKRTGRASGEDVELPTGPDTEGMAGRVRAILDEIRSRASDRNRPAEEREYLKRLEKQF